MRLLLDTHIYIWVAEGNKRLSNRARDVIQQAEMVYVSSVSIVEAAIKANQGKLGVDVDPFDRLLIAQAISEPLNLLTADKRLPQYSPLVNRHA